MSSHSQLLQQQPEVPVAIMKTLDVLGELPVVVIIIIMVLQQWDP